MSHLTAPMPSGHRLPRSYPLDFPRPPHPLTPPDTDYDALSHQAPLAQNMIGLETDPFPSQQVPPATDSPYATLHRKRPSVSYVNSGLRESSQRVVQRGLKWLVVVVPPVSFTREHGHLGHTLSTGPTRRLSNGLLMPLYPTLNSQLGAIAREFSFPSISGICVYLHTTQGGVSLSPRVSDDSWPLLWGHLFDARSPSLPIQQLPISGQIEFDIDLSKARWYDSWLSSSRRDYVDVPQSVTPSRAQSISHWRGDSQTSINEPLDDQTDAISVVQPPRNSSRNIKKLSLLDRLDSFSVRSGSKLVPRDESPPSQTTRQGGTLQALSPIVQEDEPATAKKDIDSRVQSWRMSATAAARSPLAATGQTSLDPANLPNTMTDLPTASTSEMHSELNLDDYTWSVSSVGPPDYDLESVDSWDRLPSVHMDRRFEGSVCLTASYCTSFGPDDDYYPMSPTSYMSRLPSPDLAWRMVDDAPVTPTTATSWGAPLSFPPSPISSPYAPSVDIAARCLSSRPATPSTATSWGAPLSYPPSPLSSPYAASVDIAGRCSWSRPVTPSTATSWGAPLSYPPSPAVPYRAPSPDLGARGLSSAPNSPVFRLRRPQVEPYGLVYPYYDAARASTWQHVWPNVQESHVAEEQVLERREAGRMQGFIFPPPPPRTKAGPWKQVWPYAGSATGSEKRVTEASSATLGYPVMDIYPAVYPSFDIYPSLLTLDERKFGAPAVSSGAAYPIFNLYPAVYPSFDIYPATLTVQGSGTKVLYTRLPASYPLVEPYPPVYPYLIIYPAVSNAPNGNAATAVSRARPAIDVSLSSNPGYPIFDIYPAAEGASARRSPLVIDVKLTVLYPTFDIYPPVYPYSLDRIYPSVTAEVLHASSFSISVGVRLQYPVLEIYPPVAGSKESDEASGVVVRLPRAYPIFDIYPAVYPWNLQDTYPVIHASQGRKTGVPITLVARYPVIDIYPAVYPYSLLSIYPAIFSSVDARPRDPPASTKPTVSLRPSARSLHTRKSSKRGLPPVPPLPKNARELTPFSPVSRRPLPLVRVERSVVVRLNAVYPNVCPYPPVYPYLSIYPETSSGMLATMEVALSGKVDMVSQYPHLVIYPAVYPHLEVYPGSWGNSAGLQIPPQSTTTRRRPKFSHMELRSQVLASTRVPESAPVPARRRPRFTHMELRAQVLDSVQSTATPGPTRRRPTLTHMQLHEQVLATEPAARKRELPQVVVAEPTPSTAMSDAFSPPEPEFEFVTPAVRSDRPAPPDVPFSPPEPEFEIIAVPAPAPALRPVSVVPRVPSVSTRSRSGTVSSRPLAPPGPPPSRPVTTRPSIPAMQPIPSPTGAQDASPAPPPVRTLNRLSGLPSHPAVGRRPSSAAPRPMSTFGPLPAVPEPTPGPTPVRRQRTMMSPLEEERSSPIKQVSPQLPSPPEEWQRSYRTPTDTSPTSRLPGMAKGLSRSNTMPSRPAPRGPRSSTLIAERARMFSVSNGSGESESPTKMMSTLAEFPAPPRPPLPTSPSRPVVSRLDRSKYPFA